MPNAAIEKIDNAVMEFGKKNAIKKYRLIRWKKALEIGPRKWRVRIDFYVF